MTDDGKMEDQLSTERVFFEPPIASEAEGTWWSRYSLALTGMTSTARAAIEADARYVLRRGILGDGIPGDKAWPASRVRTGLVMGSVQSG